MRRSSRPAAAAMILAERFPNLGGASRLVLLVPAVAALLALA
jgi:hypothetical protein